MLDIGINSENQISLLKDIDLEPEYEAQFSKLVVEAYKEKIVPLNCNRKSVRKIKKIIDGSMSYGKKNMFKEVKNEN